MTYKCPHCEKDFGVAELQQPGGIGGGSYCPRCGGRVYVSFAYGGIVAVISLLIAIGILALFRVTSIIGFAIGIILIWVPLSLYLNAMSIRYKPATLKKWKERRRTFFEWLYDRDAPHDMFDKRR
jgi:DNA-directed RNA polymerase subunit RPC12/RpoP